MVNHTLLTLAAFHVSNQGLCFSWLFAVASAVTNGTIKKRIPRLCRENAANVSSLLNQPDGDKGGRWWKTELGKITSWHQPLMIHWFCGKGRSRPQCLLVTTGYPTATSEQHKEIRTDLELCVKKTIRLPFDLCSTPQPILSPTTHTGAPSAFCSRPP